MKKLLLALTFFHTLLNVDAQYTIIPDANFEQELITLGYDTILDGQVLTSNISSITLLTLNNKNISDLTGIEDFSSLTNLECKYNQLLNLDITQNINLLTLDCSHNQLPNIDVTQNSSLFYLNISYNLFSSLNVTQNLALKILFCESNQLTSINISQNIALENINCGYNQLTNIDFSSNTSLKKVNCPFNQLTSIDLSLNSTLIQLLCQNNLLSYVNIKNGNNVNMIYLYTTSNLNLACIIVDNIIFSTTNWTPGIYFKFDTGIQFTETTCTVNIIEDDLDDLNLYPNPTTNKLYINLKVGIITSINITNSLGQVLLSDIKPSSKQLEIDLSSYPTGIYFLQFNVDEKVIIKKIIKK